MKVYSYLALGDSYTIGEQVRITESFPYQTVQLLRKALSALKGTGGGLCFMPPEIIAVTGFTTDELSAALDKTVLLPKYDFVSLLIGVNDQYRGRPVDEFEKGFEILLQRAIRFSGGSHQCVYVLSIPDWGVTAFAKGKDIAEIAAGIDAYNTVCETIAAKYEVQFIDITATYRKNSSHKEFIATDKLHPSGREYAQWAGKLSEKILLCLK